MRTLCHVAGIMFAVTVLVSSGSRLLARAGALHTRSLPSSRVLMSACTTEAAPAGDIGHAIAAASRDTITVVEGIWRMHIAISSDKKAPASKLTSPDNRVFSTADTTRGVFKDSSADNRMVWWTVIDPLVGQWIFDQESPDSSDVVDITQEYRRIVVDFDQIDTNIDVRWTDVGDPSLDTIDFFIGEASWGSRGQYVGSAARNSLYARLIVPDDMRECVSYLSYSYGASTDREYVKRNIKGRVGTLPTPENVYIQIPERSSEGWLHWNRLSDSSVLGYRVYVSTEGDRSGDSLHAIVSADVHMLFLGGVIPTNGYFVQAFGANELQSCKARCSIVVSTNDDQHEDVKPVSGINVLPHPVQQTSIVRVANARTVGSDIIIRDLRGEIVTTLPLHQVAPMVYEAPWSCRDLVNGVYFIQVHTHNGVVTYKASVTK